MRVRIFYWELRGEKKCTNLLLLCINRKRTAKIPGYTAKKTWSEITTELTRNLYNYRESMLRLAASSKNPAEAKTAAEKYFSDLNDIFVFATKKNPEIVTASYEQSLKDLATFKTLIK